MSVKEDFAVYIQHGGKFGKIGSHQVYTGGSYEMKGGLDVDRFGYFDLEDQVKGLGYERWENLWYKVPKTETYRLLTEDKDVMQMLSYLTAFTRVVRVFVDGGHKSGESSRNVTVGGIGDDVRNTDVQDDHVDTLIDGYVEDLSEEDKNYCLEDDELASDKKTIHVNPTRKLQPKRMAHASTSVSATPSASGSTTTQIPTTQDSQN